MNKSLAVAAGVLALVGLIVNVAIDRDNIYDMTMSGIWLITLILAFLSAFIGKSKVAPISGQPARSSI